MSETATDIIKPGLAIFDLDYTLTKRGTWGRFVWQWIKFRPHVWLPLLISAGWVQWQYKRGRRPRVDVKLAMMRWAMKGATREQVLDQGRKFAAREAAHGLRPGARNAIEEHRQKGDVLIMISAAVDVIAKPIGELINFNHIVSTEMDFDSCNKLKLNFKTPNCYGEEKVNRFNDLMDKFSNLKQYHTDVTFYSDSYSDLAMFHIAHICVAIHPDKKLSRYASEQGWRIFKW